MTLFESEERPAGKSIPAPGSLVTVGPRDRDEVLELFAPHPVPSVYLTSEVLAGELGRDTEWCGARREGRLTAVAMLNASGLLSGYEADSGGLAELGPWLRLRASRVRLLVGERRAIATMWSGLQADAAGIRWQRSQRVFELSRGNTRIPPGTAGIQARAAHLEVRQAKRKDLDAAIAATAAMHLEEMGDDPLAINRPGWEERIRDKIGRGRLFVWMAAGELRFTAGISAVTPSVAQIDGVYVPPRWRRQGTARAALAGMCTQLFAGTPGLDRLCLFVNDTNEPAIRAYHASGFVPTIPYLSIRTLVY